MKIIINNEASVSEAIKGRNHKLCKPVICIETGEVYPSGMDAAEAAGVHWTNMAACCRGELRTCKGKHYVYASHTSENLDVLTALVP